MATDRTPIRQRLKAFLTPKIADFLVTESKHVAYRDLPEFGTPHPDTTRYPNHKFCYAMPEDEMGQRYSAVYAMDRANQDDYNWEFAEADIGGTKFDAVQRTYVSLRSQFNSASPTQGAAMPDVPEGVFSSGHVLAERKQIRSSDKELDTIFVVEQRLYVKKVTLTDNEIDRETGEVERVSTTLFFRGESLTVGGTTKTIEEWVADTTSAYWVTDANGYGREAKQLSENWFSVTHKVFINADSTFEVSADRLRAQRYYCPDGTVTLTTITPNATPITEAPALPSVAVGQAITISQKGRIRTTRTVTQDGNPQVLRSLDFMPDDGYAYPSTDTLVTRANVPTTAGRLDELGRITVYNPIDGCDAAEIVKQAVSLQPETRLRTSKMAPDRFFRSGQVQAVTTTQTGVLGTPTLPAVNLGTDVDITQKGAIRTTRTVTQPEAPSPNRGTTFDQRTGEQFIEIVETVPIEQVAATAVDADGNIISFDPIDANWSTKVTRKAVSTLSRTWTEIVNYEWPPVLLRIDLKVWNAKNGRGAVTFPIPRFKQGFSGPQAMQVTQYWQKAQPVVVPAVTMIAEGFQYRCPLFSISVPPCLHGAQLLTCSIGNTDPDWEMATDAEIFPATNYTDWPAQIFWRESKPYLGGFLVTEYTINRPQ